MSPLDLPSWQWFLVAFAAGLVALLLAFFSSKREKRVYFSIVMYCVFGVAAVVCAIIGIIQFVKWARGS